ncbi:P80 family lipoprotein [Mycoplasma tullyi]|uniref:P80 family lipoprotein n=1 Tax=Mycoplasma tullyi TaxID=1612150 RepID=A0A7D7Y6B5_9MOLU|nr:P80 family lipoprotein [Mycoplasma tullyi]QMT98556.1 P80 family lipoprotein [Mycoplasma tullyi]
MKLKSFKKVIGALGVISGASLFVASCTRASTRFDQVDDGKLVLASSFSSSSPITLSLNDVITQYNKTKPATDYPVEIFSIAGGYSGGQQTVNTKLASKDKTQFFNLIFNYPVVTAQLVRYDAALKLNKGAEPVDVSVFPEQLLQENYDILGNTDRSVYGVPFTRSTEVLVTNVPVVYQLLSQAMTNGDLKISEDPETQKLWAEWRMKAQSNLGNGNNNSRSGSRRNRRSGNGNKLTEDGTAKTVTEGQEGQTGAAGTPPAAEMPAMAEMASPAAPAAEQPTQMPVSSEFIKKLWGDYRSVDGGLKGYTFSAAALNTTTSLLDLSTRIAKSYPDNLKPVNDRKPTSPQGVIGIDSPSNYLYNATFSQVNGDKDKFMIRKTADNRAYDYNALLKNQDDRNEQLKNAFNALSPLIDANGLFLNDGGNYSSNWGKYHQLGFFLSSTSGFYQSFVSNQSFNLVFKGVDASVGTYQFPNFTSNLYAPTQEEYNAGALAAYTSSRQRWVIYKKDKLTDELKQTKTNIAITDEAHRQKAEEALSKALESMKSDLGTENNKKLIGYIGTGFELDKFDPAVKDKVYEAGNLNNRNFMSAFVLTSDVDKVAIPSEQSLQVNEADIRVAPTKFYASATKNTIITQGPSLIGIHANEKEDIQTKRFINWLIKGSVDIPATMNADGRVTNPGYKGTPLNYLVAKASYILPTREFLNDPKNESTNNPYQNIATHVFKSVLDDPTNYVPYNDAPDFRSGTFRQSLDSTLVSANSSKSNFDTFISNLDKAVPAILKQN